MAVNISIIKCTLSDIFQHLTSRMSTSLLSLHPLTRKVKYLDWNYWHRVERDLLFYTQQKSNSSIWEGERYHLYYMHTGFFQGIVDKLRIRLGCINHGPVALNADCVWVDGTPKAHWNVNGVGAYVELADLLLELKVTTGAATRRRAMLIQAKYTDKYDDLGRSACQTGQADSTNLERDLLEVHSGAISLYASGKTTTPIPAPHLNVFDVSKDIPGQKLIDHTRYLLCPSDYNRSGTPYLSLTPYGRGVGQGFHEEYEEMLLRLADVSTSTVPDLQPGQQWTALVDAIGAWSNANAVTGKTINRFGKKWNHRNSQLITTPLTAAYFSTRELVDFWDGNIGPSFGWLRDNSGSFFGDEPRPGFWHIRLSIEYL